MDYAERCVYGVLICVLNSSCLHCESKEKK